MLDITIYKVVHGGDTEKEAITEARKLLPYIKKSDVFSLELTAYSEEEFLSLGGSWSALLQNPSTNRSNFRRVFDASAMIPLVVPRFPSQRIYLAQLQEYLFRNKIGLWFAEQYPTREVAREFNRELNQIAREWVASLVKVNAKLLGAESEIYKLSKKWDSLQDSRDKIVGQIAKDAEPLIRKTYPWLAQKEVIQWGIPFGSFHEPEKYIPGAKVVNLSIGDADEINGNLRNKINSGASLEEVCDLIREVAKTTLRR